MNDPLQRRMFAQQVMNMYNNRQPMGILASSPQLMGAVQNYASGGAVKGYQLGGLGLGNTKNPTFLEGYSGPFTIQDQLAIEKEKEDKRAQMGVDGLGTKSVSLDDLVKKKEKETIEGKDLKTVEEDINQDKTTKPNVDSFKGSKTGEVKISQPIIDEKSEIKEPGVEINNKNREIIDKKSGDEEFPKGKNLAKRKDTSNIDEQIQAASTSYEGFREKLAKTDKAYKADEATRTDFMTKIQGLIDEKEDEISLDDVDKKAREVLGLKEGEKYDEDRVTAFWMSMIKGGLATAAGESDNALTNIAKGLMFGVDSYGKDMNLINAQEREDRKSLAKMKYDLMKDEKAARVAERTLKIQAYGELAKLEEQKFQFKTKFEYEAARNEILDNLAMAKLDLTSMQVLNAMKMGDLNYEAKIREIALNEKKQEEYVKLTEKQLSMQLRDKQATKEIKNIFALGPDYATYEDGEFKFTTKGRAMLIAATASKTKFTDLVTSAKAAGRNKTIEGYKYETSQATEDAYFYYVGVTKPKLEALVKTTKDRLGGIDNDEYRKQEKIILEQFAKDTGGVLEGDGSTSYQEGKIYIDKNGIKRRYKNGQFVDP